jgi:hypothetical protein
MIASINSSTITTTSLIGTLMTSSKRKSNKKTINKRMKKRSYSSWLKYLIRNNKTRISKEARMSLDSSS